MSEQIFYPRHIEPRLAEALEDAPVVLIHGPRQCGKTTLAQYTCAPAHIEWPGAGTPDWPGIGRLGRKLPREHREYAYISFDDDIAREGARLDPAGFVADLPERVILDEIQLVPGLFPAIKLDVDRNRTPGRFILAGSTNVLLLPALSESLAGRLQIVRLHPLSRHEMASRASLAEPDPGRGFLPALFEDGFRIVQAQRLGSRLAELIVAGGFPRALARPTARRKGNWYRDYIETLIQRDVRELARIRSLETLPPLLRAAASQTARLFNLADLAAPFQLSRPTIREYITLLERLFLLETLPPWHSNRLKRLVKTSKLHLGDTGVAAALLGLDPQQLTRDRPLLGQFLETFVFQELRRQGSWQETPVEFHHFRDRDGVEVDIVLEQGAHAIAGVEVKASATVTNGDFRGLRKLRSVTCDRFRHGVVLYDGETTVPFGDGFYAVPMRQLWTVT